MKKENLPFAIKEAINVIRAHNAIVPDSVKAKRHTNGSIRIEMQFKAPLPSRCSALGFSSTGVRKQEPVILDFPKTFPFRAPKIMLREDFNRSLPHINPGTYKYVRPCVYEGDLNELLHQDNGISGILDQISLWLTKAAANQLIDPHQGWEPIRRDIIEHTLIFNVDLLRERVQTKEDFLTFLCSYYGNDNFFTGRIVSESLKKVIRENIRYMGYEVEGDTQRGIAIGIFTWPNDDYISNKYSPEKVGNLEELCNLAKEYGCYEIFWAKIQEIYKAYTELKEEKFKELKIIAILCVRRPVNLINDDSKLELIPYIIKCNPSKEVDISSPVFPLGHRHMISAKLLSRMSGAKLPYNDGPIVQLGCGSIGSKIVLHLARGGHGPFVLMDNKRMAPYNAARHALIDISVFYLENKAEAMKKAISTFPQTEKSEAQVKDIIDFLLGGNSFPEKTSLIIDSTASLAVRETLAMVKMLPGVFMHTVLYSNGECGVLAIEGPERNPRIDDLIVKMFDFCIDDKTVLAKIVTAHEPITRQSVGQGCSSYTMIMPDTRVSLFSAAMAERARQILEEGAPSKAELQIGLLSEGSLGIIWNKFMLDKTIVVKPENTKAWEIRILANADEAMIKESLEHGTIETGGVLLGRISFARRCVTISRILPAPPDSKRSETEFILGTEGLKEMVKKTQEASGGLLTYVGTWHSHPSGSGPSSRDHGVLMKMRELRLGAPSIVLIFTPTGFTALFDEGDLKVD